MKLLQNRTPVQLLWSIAALNLLVAIGFSTLALVRRFYYAWHPLLLCSFVLIVLSLIGSLVAEQELKEGIASEQWPDALLNGPRRLHSAFLVLAGLFIVASFVCIIAISNAQHFGGAWVFLYPAMSFTRLGNYLRPRAASNKLTPSEPPKPLHSEHWGTQPRPFSN